MQHHPAPSSIPSPWQDGNEFAFTVAQRRKKDAMKHSFRLPRDLPVEFIVTVAGEPKPGDNFMPNFMKRLCPVIGARKDRTKLLVIAPDGSDQWVKWR